jgi:hypothetical protein
MCILLKFAAPFVLVDFHGDSPSVLVWLPYTEKV